jgi:hypothetical protein
MKLKLDRERVVGLGNFALFYEVELLGILVAVDRRRIERWIRKKGDF